MSKLPLGQDVMNWPEFEALAKRLGIFLDGRTRRIVIDLEIGCEVRIDHNYIGGDESTLKRAGEKLERGDAVYHSEDGKLYRSRPPTPDAPHFKS